MTAPRKTNFTVTPSIESELYKILSKELKEIIIRIVQ